MLCVCTIVNPNGDLRKVKNPIKKFLDHELRLGNLLYYKIKKIGKTYIVLDIQWIKGKMWQARLGLYLKKQNFTNLLNPLDSHKMFEWIKIQK